MQTQPFDCTRRVREPRASGVLKRSILSESFRRLLFVSILILPSFAHRADSQSQKWPEYSSLDSTFSARDSIIGSLHREIRRDSNNLDAWIRLFDMYKQLGEVEKELQLATAMAAANPYVPRAFHTLGDAQLDNGMMPEAVVSLRRALALEPRYVRALTTLAEAYDLLFMRDTALHYLDSAIHCNPRNAQAHFQKAELLTRMGRRVEAIDSYRSWANLQPHAAEPWIKLGEAQSIIGDYSDAIETLNYALSLNPDSPEALFQLAVAKQGTGQTVEAKEAFKDFFFRFPRHTRAQEAEELARALGWRPGGDN